MLLSSSIGLQSHYSASGSGLLFCYFPNMEQDQLGGIISFLENKTILVTGSTGFLAKVLVEKILRVQPKIRRIYLLVRAHDSAAATKRLYNEILGKELFRLLKEHRGSDLSNLVTDRVLVPVPGDVSFKDLGIEDAELKKEMWNDINLVINVAGTTNFDERYDVALAINTSGPLHSLEFAKKCAHLMVFAHVSTAYVRGEQKGVLKERPWTIGETVNGIFDLDIDYEFHISQERLEMLKKEKHCQSAITAAMKDFGNERAKKFGWPNTYVFTKAMGEMVLGKFRGTLPLVIIRPTIITSTFREPFPGWIEGIRSMDSIAVSYGKGRVKCCIGNMDSVMDLVPADMVVNSIIVAVAVNSLKNHESIYNVGSSKRNPVKYSLFPRCFQYYFIKNPWTGKDGKPVQVGKIKILDSVQSFHDYMLIHYILPLQVLELANYVCCNYFEKTYISAEKKLKSGMRLAELFSTYLLLQTIYDDTNTHKLRTILEKSGDAADKLHFQFDPICIKWEDYIMKVHLPGVVKYLFK